MKNSACWSKILEAIIDLRGTFLQSWTALYFSQLIIFFRGQLVYNKSHLSEEPMQKEKRKHKSNKSVLDDFFLKRRVPRIDSRELNG